ncbi:MAG: LysR family transcriptional regulator [Polyangiaceae bacterium]|nr:LysR family transcriptional regulator [Polyangiaceae bacterium]
MRGSEFAELSAFAAIVQHGSFVRAAAHLGVSPSALSQTIRQLEERLGVRLLHRTTRSVAPSEAGERLLGRIGPALTLLDEAVAEVRASREQPSGRLRINAPRMAATRIIAPRLGRFLSEYPDVVLDVVVEDALTDIVAGRFDAGIRIGERLTKGMVAVKLTGEFEMMAVASPAYFARHGEPKTAKDLHAHRCINWRWPTDGSVYRWELEHKGQELEVAVDGPLLVNDVDLVIEAALQGVGIAYTFDERIYGYLAEGKLRRVLVDWSPRFPGLYLYYPSRRQISPALRAFIDCVREAAARSASKTAPSPRARSGRPR